MKQVNNTPDPEPLPTDIEEPIEITFCNGEWTLPSKCEISFPVVVTNSSTSVNSEILLTVIGTSMIVTGIIMLAILLSKLSRFNFKFLFNLLVL